MDDNHTVIPDGSVYVVGNTVAAMWSGATPPAGLDLTRASVVDPGPGTLIFPGMINLHDHPSYDVLPLWPPPSSHRQPEAGRPAGTEPYANRYQWNTQGATSPQELRRIVQSPQDILLSVDGLELYAEVMKRAEARGVLAGQTSIQGEGDTEPVVDGLLSRNTNGANFGRNRVEQRVPSVEDPAFTTEAAALKARADAGQVDAWLVHLGEGVRDSERRLGDMLSSRHELDRIAQLGILNDAAVAMHGVGFERTDFATMRAAPTVGVGGGGLGAKLVWSPLSNLLLYGRTAEVYDALAEGVTVSLGTDWTPSGSNTLLGELKVADLALRDTRLLGDSRSDVPPLLDDFALDRALVDMVTRNPARTLRWPEVGTIDTGKVADLFMMRRPTRSPTGGMPASPYRSLIDATERDIALVLVDGDPRAGDVEIMRALRGRDLDIVTSTTGGYSKAIDVTGPGIPHGHERLARIERRLAAGLRALGGDGAAPGSGPRPPTATYSYLRKHLEGGRYVLTNDAAFRDQVLAPRYGRLPDGRINLERIELRPLLAHDDHFFFALLGGLTDPAPPFLPYPFNANFVTLAGNPFVPAAFATRWWF
jgi:cytosine/adenosine deaminase-related metal-dependent hydrolase